MCVCVCALQCLSFHGVRDLAVFEIYPGSIIVRAGSILTFYRKVIGRTRDDSVVAIKGALDFGYCVLFRHADQAFPKFFVFIGGTQVGVVLNVFGILFHGSRARTLISRAAFLLFVPSATALSADLALR